MTNKLPVMIRIYAGGVRQSVYLTTSGENIVFDFTAEASRMIPIPQNKWVNITLETYVIDNEQPISSANVQTKAYINGEFVADLSSVDVSTTSSEQVDIQLQYTNSSSWICVDNVYLGYIDKEFVASKEPVPENMPTIADGNWGNGVYYNGECEGNRYDYDGKVAKPTITGGSSISKTYISDDIKRAIYFYKSIPEGASNGQATIPYYFSSTVPTDTKAIIFEADVAFAGFSNYTGTKAPNLQFNFVKDGWLAGFFIGADENGKIYTQFGKVVSGTNLALDENTWYNLRFEVYMGNADRKSVAKVYVDGEYVCDLNPGDDKATNSSAKSVSIVLRQFETDDWFVYDNVYLGYSSTAYVAPDGTEPETPGSGSGGSGDSGDDTPTVPEEPTVTSPTITGEKGSGEYYGGEAEGNRIDTATLAVPNFGSVATAAIINEDFFYATKNVYSGTANAQTNLPKAYFGAKPEGAIGYVVEFDFALGDLSHTNVQFDIGLGGLYGSLYLYAGNPDAAVTTNFSSITAGANIALEQNKWYNIRLVAYDVDGLPTFKLYVDGAYTCDIPSADKNKTSPNDYFIITLRQFDDDNWVAYDNLYLGYTDEAYIYGDPDSYVETPEGITGDENKGKGEYYNGDAAGTRLDGTSAGSINMTEIGDDAKLELTKDGEILFRKDVTDTQSKSYIRINLPTAPTGAVASVVEFDMVMSTTMSEKYAGLVFMIEALGYRGDIFFKGNGETYGSGHPTLVKSGSNISVKQGEWHNIRIVTYAVDGVIIFKVYVDGAWTMDIRTANNTKTSSSKRITLYMQEYDEGNDDYILIDNIYLGYTDAAYVEGVGN